MKRLNLSDSELRLVIILLALCMLAVSYFFGFSKLNQKAAEVEALNVTDAQKVTQLEQMVTQRAKVEAEIVELNQYITDTIAKYPIDVPTEKSIYLVQEIEDNVGAHFSAINFLMDTRLTALDGAAAAADPAAVTDAAAETGATDAVSGPVGYYDTLTMSYDASYYDFKDMVEYIHSYDDRMTIPSISAAYDSETGNISGVISVRMYYLTGTEREYEQVPETGVNHGVNNIFGGE